MEYLIVVLHPVKSLLGQQVPGKKSSVDIDPSFVPVIILEKMGLPIEQDIYSLPFNPPAAASIQFHDCMQPLTRKEYAVQFSQLSASKIAMQ